MLIQWKTSELYCIPNPTEMCKDATGRIREPLKLYAKGMVYYNQIWNPSFVGLSPLSAKRDECHLFAMMRSPVDDDAAAERHSANALFSRKYLYA